MFIYSLFLLCTQKYTKHTKYRRKKIQRDEIKFIVRPSTEFEKLFYYYYYCYEKASTKCNEKKVHIHRCYEYMCMQSVFRLIPNKPPPPPSDPIPRIIQKFSAIYINACMYTVYLFCSMKWFYEVKRVSDFNQTISIFQQRREKKRIFSFR